MMTKEFTFLSDIKLSRGIGGFQGGKMKLRLTKTNGVIYENTYKSWDTAYFIFLKING